MSRAKHFANVVVSQLNTTIVTAGSFVVTPAVLFGLGDAGYGGWLLINSFTSYLRLLDLGASAGTVKYGAGAEQRADAKDLARVLNTSAAIFLVLGAAAMLATMALAVLVPRVYPIAADHAGIILILGGGLALELALRPYVATLRMRSLYYVYDAAEIGTYAVFKLGLLLYFAHLGALSYRVLALLTLGETLLRMAFVVSAALLVSPATRRINPLRAHRSMVKKLATMGAAVSIIMVADVVRFQIDAGVIGYFLPESPESISIYGVGSRLASIAYTVIGVIGRVLIPRFSALAEAGKDSEATALLRRASHVTGLASSFLFVNLAVLGPQFLALWLGKAWITTSSTILLVLLPGYFIALLADPSGDYLLGRGQLRGLTLLTVAEAVTNLCVSAVLVHPLGALGVALGTSVPMAFFRGVLFPMLLKKEIGVRRSEYVKMHVPAIGIGATYLLLVGGLSFVSVPTYARFVALGTGSTLVFALLVLVALPDARKSVLARLRRSR